MFKDCQGKEYPVYTKGNVAFCKALEGAKPEGSVFLLSLITDALPKPGQFFMLHPERSNVILGRPISVFHTEVKENNQVEIHFLILVKGKGTQELCSLQKDDKVNLLGPCGNCFELKNPSSPKKVLIVGGGIGVAPVAGFAESLKAKSYDFYASFKSGSYGLDHIDADKLVITTDDGSVGIKGMLPAALTKENLIKGNYEAVYACGPAPMLAYVKSIAEEASIPCFLSMESRMACGVGVCLGCTIETTEGKKRCCKDGPVFDSRILKFEKPADSVAGIKVQPRREALQGEADLSVEIAGVKFKNPVIACSGTFGFGTEYSSIFDINKLGGIASKGLTLEARQGNNGIRVWETPSGLMNSIGLQNPGIEHFIKNELPQMMAFDTVTIANLSGSTMETYVEGAKLLDKTQVPMIELNISCPNVKAGGAAWGMTCNAAAEIVKAVRGVTKKPLIVKLTPQSLELNKVALACIEQGADGISLCNSFQGIAVDIERGVPVFENLKAGVGGPAIRPIAVRLVYELVEAINQLPEEKRVPVMAIGGIATWEDAVEFIMAGASAVQVGTATFANPLAMIEIVQGLAAFMKRKGYSKLSDFRGCIQKKTN